MDAVQSVTVLMPVYNGARHLAAAVESIQRQTHGEFEFLIVDDGSTDGSAATLEAIAARDARLRVVRVPHRGIVAALNRGLELASGTIIVRMDADDIAWPERIERQLSFLADNPEVAVVGSAIRVIGEDGRIWRITRFPVTPPGIANSLRQDQSPIAHSAAAFRRAAVMEIGGYRSQFNYAEDLDLWLRLCEHHAIANLPEVLLDYRVHHHKVSVRRRREQVLAAHIANLAARERRRGHPDPAAELGQLCLADLDRFDMPAHERASILLDLSESGLTSFEATGSPAYLTDVEESLFHHGYPDPARARPIALRLARHHWTKRNYRGSAVALGYIARSEASRLHRQPRAANGRRRHITSRADRNIIGDWLLYCADPLKPLTDRPRRLLSPDEAAELFSKARAHGVLPAVLRNFVPFAQGPEFAKAKEDAVARRRSAAVQAMMLRQHGNALLTAATGISAAIVKGPIFARHLYPVASLRPFTDIDFLVAPDAMRPFASLLEEHGFRLFDEENGRDRKEWKWLHRENDLVMVEVQTDLVHAPSLCGALSLTYEHIGDVVETPAALLAVAVIHGALGRHFELLGHLVDICMAARKLTTIEDERRFEQLMGRTGARLAARTGLELAGRLFAEPRCLEIARALGEVRHAGLAGLLIDRSVVLSTMTSARPLHSWRRQAFRVLLKRGSRLSSGLS